MSNGTEDKNTPEDMEVEHNQCTGQEKVASKENPEVLGGTYGAPNSTTDTTPEAAGCSELEQDPSLSQSTAQPGESTVHATSPSPETVGGGGMSPGTGGEPEGVQAGGLGLPTEEDSEDKEARKGWKNAENSSSAVDTQKGEMEVDRGEEIKQKREIEKKREREEERERDMDTGITGSWWGRSWSQRDTDNYRKGYPKKTGPSIGRKNFEFYTNKMECQPDGLLIDEIHTRWPGDYRLLEYKHGYIQWLFPIRERGLNWEAQELNEEEIQAILADDKAKNRILISYEMMLDFYGMRLKSRETGDIERAGNWRERFQHLNYSMHNYMRITRILKCLGEFGYEHLKTPFIRFVLMEAIVEGTLSRTLDSCRNYWIQVLRDDKEREQMENYCEQLLACKKGKKKLQLSPEANLPLSFDQNIGNDDEFSSDEESTSKHKQKQSTYKEFPTIP